MGGAVEFLSYLSKGEGCCSCEGVGGERVRGREGVGRLGGRRRARKSRGLQWRGLEGGTLITGCSRADRRILIYGLRQTSLRYTAPISPLDFTTPNSL